MENSDQKDASSGPVGDIVTSAPNVETVHTMFPELYGELKRLAHARLSQSNRHCLLDTTALVHESYLRLNQSGAKNFADKGHFLAYAASAMRSVLVDFIRSRNTDKRGGGLDQITLDTSAGDELGTKDEEIVDVHDALLALEQVDARLVRVVEMRYFAGLSDDEIATSLKVSTRTVARDWERARLLLIGMLGR